MHSSGRLRTRSNRWRGARRRRRPGSWRRSRSVTQRGERDRCSSRRDRWRCSTTALSRPPRGGRRSIGAEATAADASPLGAASPSESVARVRADVVEAPRHRSERDLSLPLECTELLLLGNGTYSGPTRISKCEWQGFAFEPLGCYKTTTVTRKIRGYLVWTWNWHSLKVAYDESAFHAISRKRRKPSPLTKAPFPPSRELRLTCFVRRSRLFPLTDR